MSEKNILIVDDNESICKLMRELITRKFSTIFVKSVTSGEESVEKVKYSNYDLII